MQVRWPGISDAERLERALEIYAINNSASVPWFDEAGNPSMKPYRPHEQHIRKLEKKNTAFAQRFEDSLGPS